MLRITNRFYAKMSVVRNTQDLYRIFQTLKRKCMMSPSRTT